MSEAIPDTIAEAVKEALNAKVDWSLPFQAKHLEIPEYTLEELNTVRVTVIDADVEVGRLSRAQDYHDVAIDAIVQRRCTDDTIKPRQLKYLAQEILSYMSGYDLRSDVSSISLMGIVRRQMLAHKMPEEFRDKKVFMAVARITYRVAV